MLNDTPARDYALGMGEAVADRTINRKLSNGKRERWADVAKRVSIGNALLHPSTFDEEFAALHKHLRKASLLMSGRHLQHGDETQPTRNMEVFTNCSTAATSFLSFYLLLNGSGVGRAYDDNMMKVDWSKMPITVPVICQTHQDVQSGEIKFSDESSARHFYEGKQITTFLVPDSREGWAKAVEHLEMMTFDEKYRDQVLLLDFSDVRPRGAPIGGMQNRPASGPNPLMTAIANVANLRDAGLAPWRATLYADHYFAECVLVGGARRAARMATKNWRDKSVLDFIAIKQKGHLWSSNNSVTVDAKWRRYVKKVHTLVSKQAQNIGSAGVSIASIDALVDRCLISDLEAHAYKVFTTIASHSYHDGSGEPGIINQDKLTFKTDGVEGLIDGKFAESARYKLEDRTLVLMKSLAKAFVKSPYKTITNPCIVGSMMIAVADGRNAVRIDELAKDGKDVPVYSTNVETGQVEIKMGRVPRKTKSNVEIWKLKLDDGSELIATPDHQIMLSSREFRPLKDLKPGDSIFPFNSFNCNGYRQITNTGAKMIGGARRNRRQYRLIAEANGIKVDSKEYAIHHVDCDGSNDRFENLQVMTHEEHRKFHAERMLGEKNPYHRMTEEWKDNFATHVGETNGRSNANPRNVGRTWMYNPEIDELRCCTVKQLKTLEGNWIPGRSKSGASTDMILEAGRTLFQKMGKITKQLWYEFARTHNFPLNLSNHFTWNEFRNQVATNHKVVSVEFVGHEDVYNITVDDNHNYHVITSNEDDKFVTSSGICVKNCGEIVLIMLGGYCVIADVVPYHAGPKRYKNRKLDEAQLYEWDIDATDAFKVATRALMRVNLMDSLYKKEVSRTNRIGVGFTGIHEYAWARFGFGWKDLVDEEKSLSFWKIMSRFKRAIQNEAKVYAAVLGVNVPHTDTTCKPAGTTSKLFGLTEGAHLPSMREFVRWVQFRSDDPLIKEYVKKGYPSKTLKTYGGTTIIGFPTAPTICELGMGEKLVTAPEATPEEQYQWLRLLEKWWITGMENDGVTPLTESGNQISYTLKYNPDIVSYEEFTKILMDNQGSIRCCSVMPTGKTSAYEYLPEEVVNRETYERICQAIERATAPGEELKEDVGFEHVDCAAGACPVSFNENHETA